MTKFMEQRDDVVPGEQRRLTVGRFLIITDVVNHRTCGKLVRLLNEIAHPRPATFGVPCKEIAIKQRHAFAVMIEYFPHADIRVVNGNIKSLDKTDAKKLAGRPEHTIFQRSVKR
ncbi:hypothetical protein D3C78_1020280 [compost metagenome]